MEKSLARALSDTSKNRPLWDCGSSLYDSFELKSFEHHLDSAIAASSRSFSMPHLSSDRRLPPPKPKPASRITRAVQRLIRSVFRRGSQTRNLRSATYEHDRAKDVGFYYVFYDKSGALSTIPETSEYEALLSPELRVPVRKTASERYTAATSSSIGIYCS